VQCGRFNEGWVKRRGREGELIAIGMQTREKTTNGPRGKLFPAIHFPFRFPRPYLSPYQASLPGTDLVLLGSTEDPLDLSTV
jgi:hypothetical protein